MARSTHLNPTVDALAGGTVLVDFGGGLTIELTDEQARYLARSIDWELSGETGKRVRMVGLRQKRSRGDEFTAPGSMAGSFRALREIVPNKWAPVVPHPKRGARRTSKGKVR